MATPCIARSIRDFRAPAAWLIPLLSMSVALTSNAGLFYDGVSPATVWWPGGIIPYEFDTNYSITAGQKSVIVDGIREWELAANIHIIPRTTETNFLLLRFQFGGGVDTFTLNPPILTVDNLQRNQLCHEMGHALGLDHEHVRPDRDSYINVLYTNLDPAVSNLYVIASNDTPHGSYDFESVMHYGRQLFSINGQDTLTPNPPYFDKYYYRIGTLALSVGDRAAAAYLYGAPTNALTNIVTTTADGGFGSLRAAIYFANDHPGTTITFNIPASDPGFSNGVWTIKTTGQMPPLVAEGTVIDGGTQPGYTNHPVVALDGSTAIPEVFDTSGLYIYAANCVVKKLAFINYQYCGFIFQTLSATNNTLSGCHVGIDAAGTNAAPNFYGVGAFLGASGNFIGGTNAGERNVISGNSEYGILLTDTNTSANVILGNYIGLDLTGTKAVGNDAGGVAIFGTSHGNVVGGTAAGARNVISGNGLGIAIADPGSDGNVIVGNFIGTDSTGTVGVSNRIHGVEIVLGSKDNRVGGTNPGEHNVISGNFSYGIVVADSGTENTVVQGNYVGTDATGALAVPNANGIGAFNGARNTLVGGDAPGAGNLVSGNTFNGIVVTDPGTSNTVIQGNFIGTDASGTFAVPNTNGIGVYYQARDTTIGGTNSAKRNIVSGNHGTGITVADPGTAGTVVQGNYVGVKGTGTAALGNDGNGIYVISGASGTLIGGTGPGQGNLVSGNGATGIAFYNTASNLILGNIIGADKSGTMALTNLGDGVSFYFCGQNTLGGTAAGAGNLISGNGGQGVSIGGGASNNLVLANLIGTSANGLSALPNGGSGVYLYGGAQSNEIGGLTVASRNVISGNAQSGVFFYDSDTAWNRIQGNYIGVDISGNASLGNGNEGIGVFGCARNNLIGGSTTGAGNVIAANGLRGIFLSDAGTTGNLVQGNSIGVGANGTTPLGNGLEGVVLANGASTNVVGLAPDDSGAGNQIAFNAQAGVWIGYFDEADTVGNTIRGNSIHENGKLGIDLVGGSEAFPSGITANDAGDGDSGPNNLQNFPSQTNAVSFGAYSVIKGTLGSTAGRTFILDFYGNAAADPSGNGEGAVYLGRTNVTTGGTGNAAFSFTASGNLAGQFITATATDSQSGDTSEFSIAVVVTNASAPPQFVGPYTLSGTGLSFTLSLNLGSSYRIQATTNLVASPVPWVDLTNFVATNTPIQFTDRTATNYRARFYRVVSP